ncbi:MAG: NAD(P)H-dependent oxidoreductase [Pseudomonadota bacterium]|nr:NAD(P)H-dependent oxidoreductase [Pseudomonadota bacterium]
MPTTLLQINASARAGIRGQSPHGSHTRALTERFVRRWQDAARREGQPVTLRTRDVGAAPPSAIGGDWIAAAFTPPEARSAALQAALRESDALIDELKAADVLVLGVPMYNFGPPAGFKAWIDNVVRVGATFGFTPGAANPYTPLLAERPRPVVLLTSRGEGGLNPGQALAHKNHLDPAVRQALALIGLTDWHAIAIEHDETGGEPLARSVSQAFDAVDALVDALLETRGARPLAAQDTASVLT